MKFTTVSALQNHLKKSAPHQLASIFAIALLDRFERQYYSKKIFQFLSHYEPGLKWENGELASLAQMSLFAEKRFVVIDDMDKLGKSEIDSLCRQLARVEVGLRVILTGEKIPAKLYDTLKSEMVCLDLSEEKPWDRKKRVCEELIVIAKGQQKILDFEGGNALIELCGLDLAALKSEVEKMGAYVGKEPRITLADIGRLGSHQKEQNFWAIAEDTAWRGDAVIPILKDLSAWLGIVGQIRYQLYIGVELCDQMAKGEALQVKNLRPNQIEAFASHAAKLGMQYFIDRLKDLFELELLAKSSHANPSVLWDLIMIKFSHGVTSITESIRGRSRSQV